MTNTAETPSISVVVPTHFRSEIVGAAIESVARQTTRPTELLVISDVEDLAAEAVVDEAASQIPFPVRYVRNAAVAGVCGSRNLGAAMAKGEWVAFLDDDDVWYPEFLGVLSQHAQRTEADFVLSTIMECSETRGRRERRAPEGLDIETFFSVPGGLTGSNFLIRRTAFLSVGGFDPRVTVFNDWDLFFRLVAMGAAYSVASVPLVEWRQHAGERIGSFSERRAAGLQFFVERYRPYLPAKVRRELLATAAGMRKRLAAGSADRIRANASLLRARGVAGIWSRISSRKEARP